MAGQLKGTPHKNTSKRVAIRCDRNYAIYGENIWIAKKQFLIGHAIENAEHFFS